MRFYLEGTPDVSLTEMLAYRGLKEGTDVLRVRGEIERSGLTPDDRELYKTYVEIGIAAAKDVGQTQIDAFMAREDVQAKLMEMLRLKRQIDSMMAVALNLDWVESVNHLALEHVMLTNEKGKPG